MAKHELPSPEVLRQLLDYDPETGILTWKYRDVSWFRPSATRSAVHVCALWNSRYAGKPALTGHWGLGYRAGSVLGVRVKAHRACWAIHYGKWPSEDIDHDDGDSSNNRIRNLFDRTTQQNCMNAAPHRKKSDLPPGVKFYPKRKGRRYQARIGLRGKSLSLGYHDTAEAAHAAYLAAADKHGFSRRHGRT